jgi:hypothetical protein
MSNRYATLSPELIAIRQKMHRAKILPHSHTAPDPKQRKVQDVTENPKRIEANNAFRLQILAKQRAINLRNEIDRVQSMIVERRIHHLREPMYRNRLRHLKDELDSIEKS